MDIEQKLDLIQQIHKEQVENERYICHNLRKNYNWEEGANSRDKSYYKCYGDSYQTQKEIPGNRMASFRLRLLLAVLLFLCFFVMDKKEIAFEGIDCQEIVEYIESNMEFEDVGYIIKNL